jgi:hypothetical protein
MKNLKSLLFWAYMRLKGFLPGHDWMPWKQYKGWRDQGEQWADKNGVRHHYI